MRLYELIEAKTIKSTEKSLPQRNFVAKNAPTSGAGAHTSKKFSRKEKHKNPPQNK